MRHKTQTIKNYILIICLAIILAVFYFSGFNKYLDFSVIQKNQEMLLAWANQHYLFAITLYIVVFSTLIACTIPCATIMTIVGGLVFGLSAIVYASVSVALGGFILYHAVRTAVGARMTRTRRDGWIKRMESGFKKNAFSYLLMLRLMPIFPCWISNIGAGALNVPQRTFLAATLIGILPSTIIYVFVGRGLNNILTQHETITASTILTPSLLIPLIGLAIISLLPILYKQLKERRKKR